MPSGSTRSSEVPVLTPAQQARPAAVRAVTPAAGHALLAVIERLEQVLDQETASLKENRPGSLADFNARKSHGLLELMRGVRLLDQASLDPALVARFHVLRAKLDRNLAELKMHIDAVQEISAMMAGAMRDAESDGTYSAAIRFGRR
jgi:hypothetical protein